MAYDYRKGPVQYDEEHKCWHSHSWWFYDNRNYDVRVIWKIPHLWGGFMMKEIEGVNLSSEEAARFLDAANKWDTFLVGVTPKMKGDE